MKRQKTEDEPKDVILSPEVLHERRFLPCAVANLVASCLALREFELLLGVFELSPTMALCRLRALTTIALVTISAISATRVTDASGLTDLRSKQ